MIRLEARHQAMDLSLELETKKASGLSRRKWLESKRAERRPGLLLFLLYGPADAWVHQDHPGLSLPSRVQGTSWFDHEFGSNQLTSNQVGWDWFSLHLSDGHDLMIYFPSPQ